MLLVWILYSTYNTAGVHRLGFEVVTCVHMMWLECQAHLVSSPGAPQRGGWGVADQLIQHIYGWTEINMKPLPVATVLSPRLCVSTPACWMSWSCAWPLGWQNPPLPICGGWLQQVVGMGDFLLELLVISYYLLRNVFFGGYLSLSVCVCVCVRACVRACVRVHAPLSNNQSTSTLPYKNVVQPQHKHVQCYHSTNM